MNSSDYEKQTSEARKIHSLIPEHLKSSPVILSCPPERIYHQLEFRPQTEEELQIQSGFREYLENSESFVHISELEIHSAAEAYIDFHIPYIKQTELTWARDIEMSHRWSKRPDFRDLQMFLKEGIVPSDSFEDAINDEPLPIHKALLQAKELGYKIPDSFLTPKKNRRDKEEAYYAARDLRRGQILFSEDKVIRKISSLSSSFLVPDPDEDWKTPFVIDQLWVVQETGARLRFLALEIDNQFDLTEEGKDKAKIRDEKLARQGLEVYHAAGWWCLVDSWRVISEFLSVAGVYPNARHYFATSQFGSIDEYLCEKCNQLMIRWDDFWIQQQRDEYDSDETYLVHDACLDY